MFARRFWVVGFVLCSGLNLAGCVARQPETALAAAPPAPQKQFPADDHNRPLNLAAPAKRVVCVGPGAIETLFALGAGNFVVGRDEYSDFPADALKIPIVGDFNGPAVEKAVALRPDLIVVQGETYDSARCDQWQKQTGVPVAALVATDLKGVARGIRKLGAWVGKEKAADAIAIRFEIAPKTGPRDSALVETQRSPLWVAGRGTLLGDLLRHAGLFNAAQSVVGYKAFNLESLAANPPDFYIVGEDRPDKARVLGELRKNPGLRNLLCIQKGRVVVLDGDLLYRPGPRLLEGIAQLRRETQKLKEKD